MMMGIDDEAVRQQLQAGLGAVPVGTGDFDEVQRIGRRRYRRNQALTGAVIVGAAAAIAAVLLVVVGGQTQTLKPAVSQAQLHAVERTTLHAIAGPGGRSHVDGPVTDSAGTWGFYFPGMKPTAELSSNEQPTKIHVLKWSGSQWKPAAIVATKAVTQGDPIISIAPGPTVAGDGVSVLVQFVGGDNVPGGVLIRVNNVWQLANFDGCGLPTSDSYCQQDFVQEENLVVKHGIATSYPDDDTPSHAAGTTYTTQWRWEPSVEHFETASMIATSGPLASPTVPAGESVCRTNDPARYLTVTNVTSYASTVVVTGNLTELLCGGPDDINYQAESSVESVQLTPTAVVKVVTFVSAGPRDRVIPIAALATYLTSDTQTKIFKLTGPLNGVTGMAELYHP